MSTIFLLYGYPGTGKYTIARAMRARLERAGEDGRIIDNHYVNNPIFGLLQRTSEGRVLPPGIWDRVAEVRDAVVRTIDEHSPREWWFIFTNYLVEEGVEDHAWVVRLADLAVRRGARFLAVRLECELDELVRRSTSAHRAERMKQTDAAAIRRQHAEHPLLRSATPPPLTLDVTTLSPDAAAGWILRQAELTA